MKKLILLDTDPGIDDAMAMLFGLRSLDLEFLGITTVFGNAKVEQTSMNAFRVLEVAERCDLPVAKGAALPYLGNPTTFGTRVHGEDGLGNLHYPSPEGVLERISAAEMIVKTLREHPGQVTLVAVGPLTNLALALRIEPKITGLVKEVVIMGGAVNVPGNSNAVSEANIRHDPFAAAMVFSADWPLTMVGLDVTTKVVMTRDYIAKLTWIHNPATDFIAGILPVYQHFYAKYHATGGSIYTHDPSAIAYLVDPTLFRTEEIPILVETEGHCAGFTVPDRRKVWPESRPVQVCVDVDAERLLAIFKECLST